MAAYHNARQCKVVVVSRYSPTDSDDSPARSPVRDQDEPVDRPVPEITVEHDGVRLTKFTTVTEDELRLAYVVSSSRDDSVRVHITEPCFGERATVSTDSSGVDSPPSDRVGTDGRTDGGESRTRDGPTGGSGVAIDRVVEPDGLVRVRKRFSVHDAPLPEFIPNLVVDADASAATPASTGDDADTGQNGPSQERDAHAPERDVWAGETASAASSSTVLVGIPAYNEAETIADVVTDVKEYADLVLVVDDGSDDDTAGAARGAGASLLPHETNRGYGASLQSIFRVAARADVDSLVILDGDGQHDGDDVPEIVATQRQTDADVVIGSRFVDDDGSAHVPLYRRFGIGVINLLVNLTTFGFRRDEWMTDSQSGFRAYNRAAIESIAADATIGNDMEASTDILHHVHRHGFDVAEIPTTISYDVENANSRSPFRHGAIIVWSILTQAVRDSPVVYGASGVAAILCGVALAALAVATPGETSFTSALSLAAVVALVIGAASVGVAVRRGRTATPE